MPKDIWIFFGIILLSAVGGVVILSLAAFGSWIVGKFEDAQGE